MTSDTHAHVTYFNKRRIKLLLERE